MGRAQTDLQIQAHNMAQLDKISEKNYFKIGLASFKV